MKNNVSSVVKEGLCTSCGICVGSCNKKAISFHNGKEINVPIVDDSKCVNCGICLDVCPGLGINLKEEGDKLFGTSAIYDLYAGFQLNAYTGYSRNHDIRFHSASGGLVTQFLLYLLEKKEIDGAVVVGYKSNNPFKPYPYIATTEEEIMQSRGSKYVVVSYDKIIEQIINSQKNVVVVGLPCQIQGFRKLCKRNRKLKSLVKGYFAIYCSTNKTKHSIDYYLYRYNIDSRNVGTFSFRDDGCLGFMKFTDKKGNTIKKIPYLSYWFGTHSFFMNKRCSLCTDHFGELADISFGDIHIKPYSEDHVGISSLVTRSIDWDQKLRDCFKEGKIQLDKVELEVVLKSQMYAKIYKKGAGIQAAFNLRKLMRKKNPTYDVVFEGSPGFKTYVKEIAKNIMESIGHYRIFWPLIQFLDRNK